MLSRILSSTSRWLAAAAFALALAACGSGGGMTSGSGTMPQGCNATTCGNAQLTLTDAAGDFASYSVDVTSLQLTKADGTIVETLPVKTRVDFTQLVNVSEFLTSAQIPVGEYTAAQMTLDYSNAAIFVYTDANDTQTAQVTQVVDGSGNTLYSSTPPAPTSSTITLSVKLDNKHHLFVNPGKLARLALDFNLAASNSVNLANPAAPVDTVQPFIVASVVPTDTKDVRVRGTLVSVDVSGGSYTVNVEPFDDDNTSRGQVAVNTTAHTTFEIDGTPYTGNAGLSALAAEAAGTLTVAFGTFSTTDFTFTANRVLAGTSVQMPNLDRLQGVVMARSLVNGVITLSVRGATMWMHADRDDHFSMKTVALTLGSGTMITAVGSEPSAAPMTAWPSVGSRITAFGKAGTDASNNPTFDATAGRLRIELTTLWGAVATGGVGTGQVTLNLQAIEGLPVSAFDFTGTGSDPTKYVVTTGVLPLTAVSATAPLRFFGLVQPFGFAPPDFNADTLVDFVNTNAVLNVDYGAAGSATALTTTTSSLTVVQSALVANEEHTIRIGPQLIDLTALSGDLTVSPDPSSMGPFAIRTEAAMGMGMMDTIDVFNNFADFDSMLTTKLGGGAKVERVLALGHFDQTSNTFTAGQIAIILN
ncbi:MAG TPA: DUF4382 domain-containing protein [Steroidobacteraceae bacterium]|nr:DUF4382 domain-containing protein [Steroidobacteraceae bacterium]